MVDLSRFDSPPSRWNAPNAIACLCDPKGSSSSGAACTEKKREGVESLGIGPSLPG
jgi:hypothetical protein